MGDNLQEEAYTYNVRGWIQGTPLDVPLNPERPHFWGGNKAWANGATPNSIYTYVSENSKVAVSNYIYNPQGEVFYQVDFGVHGSYPSGHGHPLTPGSLSHKNVEHIMPNLVPIDFFKTPVGYPPSKPIGFK